MAVKNSSPVPKIIGGFEILNKVGQGAMGAVFKARQVSLERVVALKLLPPKIAQQNPIFVDRFIREARASAKLSHPNIVQGIEVGKDEASGLYYFAMEFVDGPTVQQQLKSQGQFEEKRALGITLKVAEALVCANRAGIIHRDIKPDNILLTSSDEAKLADLGLAKKVTGLKVEEEALPQIGPSTNAALTQAGMAVGTPNYMAPEQARGEVERVDIRADLYALGATLFHMVVGQPPYRGKSSQEILLQHLTAPIPSAREANPKVSKATSALISKMLEKDPAKRPQKPEDLVKALQEILYSPETNTEKEKATKERSPVGSDTTHGPIRKAASRQEGAGRFVARAQSQNQNPPWVGALIGGGVLLAVLFIGMSMGRHSETRSTSVVKDQKNIDETALSPAASVKGDNKLSNPNSSAAAQNKSVPVSPVALEAESGSTTTPKLEGKVISALPGLDTQSKNPTLTASGKEPASSASVNPAGPTGPAWDKLFGELETLFGAEKADQAAKVLEEASQNPELAHWSTELKRQREAIQWLAELDRVVEAGARKLMDGQAFELKAKSGQTDTVGEGGTFKLKEIKSGKLWLSSKDGVQFPKPLADLSRSTRNRLVLSSKDAPEQRAVLKVELAYSDLIHWRDPTGGAVSALPAIQKSLEEAKNEGAPEAGFLVLQPWLERAQKRALPPIPKEYTLDLDKGLALELVLIPAGEFSLGSAEGKLTPDDFQYDREALRSEQPLVKVTLTQSFYMGKYEVTQAQYQQVMGANPSKFKGPQRPVEQVSWNDAQAFCQKLSGKSNVAVKLPTEAQWEFACKGKKDPFFLRWDDPRSPQEVENWETNNKAALDVLGWFAGNSQRQTHPVGQKTPNAWGLYDMYGNVLEWCVDRFGPYPAGPLTDPRGSVGGEKGVARGGHANSPFFRCRAETRFAIPLAEKGAGLGFRVIIPIGDDGQPMKP